MPLGEPLPLLVLTDGRSLPNLPEFQTWSAMALRSDQLQARELLFLDLDTLTISHMAFLKEDEPFVAESTGHGSPTIWIPQIAHVEELLTFSPFDRSLLAFLDMPFPRQPITRNHEALTISDVDRLFSMLEDDAERGTAELGATILVDELIRNYRSVSVQSALRYFRGLPSGIGVDLLAQGDVIAEQQGLDVKGSDVYMNPPAPDTTLYREKMNRLLGFTSD